MAEEETKPQVELDTDDAKEQDVEVKEPEKKEEPKDKINLNVGEVDLGYTEHIDKDKEKAKILIEDEPKEEEVPEEEIFATGLEDQGLDKTGRNIAFQTYKQIEQQILDAYGILGNDEDRGVFREYLLINLKLYFQKFEEEMSASVEAPDIDIPDETGEDIDLGAEEEFDLGV